MTVAFPVLAAYARPPPHPLETLLYLTMQRRLYHADLRAKCMSLTSFAQVRAIMHKCCVPPKEIAGALNLLQGKQNPLMLSAQP